VIRQSDPTRSYRAQGWMVVSKDPLENHVDAFQVIAEVEKLL
jgi:hypothetical protein